MSSDERNTAERTVLIADDHGLVRSGLAMIVSELAGFRVEAEATDGREAVELARKLQPDVVLIDLAMPHLNGLQAIPLIRRHAPEACIVVLSMHADAAHVRGALRAGATGYLLKDSAVDELGVALRLVAQGGFWVSPKVAPHLRGALDGSSDVGEPEADAQSELNGLSQRQREVLQLIAEGFGTREIAERLHIGVKTVETHRAEVMRRLDIHEVAGLTRLAVRAGLVSPQR